MAGMIARIKLLALWLLCQVLHPIVALWMLLAILVGSRRAVRMAIAYDRLGNAATGGLDTETISSRSNRGTSEGNRGWCLLCRVLDWIDRDHCKKSSGS